MCFTESEWKFLNDKHYKVSNFFGLTKIYKSMVMESSINTQNSEIIEIFEPNDLKLRAIVDARDFLTRKLNQLTDILLRHFLKCIKSFIRDSLDFLNNCSTDVYEDIEIVTFNVISLYTRIPHECGLAAIDYYLIKYQEDLHPRFKKKFVLESGNFIVKSNTLTFDSVFY